MSRHRRSTSRTRFLSVVAALTLALGATACSDATGEGGASTESGTTVNATLRDFSITLEPTSARAGALTFDITNEASTEHELEIFRGDADPESLPIESGVANMEGFELITEAEGIVGGTTTALSTDLDAGSYLIVCNLAGHFEKGMHAPFTVE